MSADRRSALFAGSPDEIGEVLPALMANLRMMHAMSRHYSAPARLAVLLHNITRQARHHSLSFQPSRLLWFSCSGKSQVHMGRHLDTVEVSLMCSVVVTKRSEQWPATTSNVLAAICQAANHHITRSVCSPYQCMGFLLECEAAPCKLPQLVRRCKAYLLYSGKIWDQPRTLLISGLRTCAGCGFLPSSRAYGT